MKNKRIKQYKNYKRVSFYFSIKQLIEEERFELALNELENYYSIPNDDFDTRFLYGKLLYYFENYEAAIEQFVMVYESTSKKRNSAAIELGKAYSKLENINCAKYYFYKAIENSEYYESYAIFRLLKIEICSNNYDSALKLCELIQDDDYQNLLEKAKFLATLNRIDEALKIIENVKKHTSLYDDDIIEIERIYINKGQVNKTKLSKSEITNLFNDIVNSYNNNIYSGFIDKCDTLIEYDESYRGEISLYKGMYYFNKRKYSKSIENYEEAIKYGTEWVKLKSSYFYGKLMYFVGNYIKAETLFLNSFIKGECDKKYLDTYYYLIYIYIRTLNYTKANEILNELNNVYKINESYEKRPYFVSEYYEKEYHNCKIIVDMNKKNHRKLKTYVEHQVVDYQETLAIKHILDRHTKGQGTYFDENIDIKELFSYIKENLTEENLVQCDSMDSYSIEYPNVGIDKGKKVNQITVIVLPGTKKIITMYPCENRYFNIYEVKQQLNKGKQNRISRFNKRFGL